MQTSHDGFNRTGIGNREVRGSQSSPPTSNVKYDVEEGIFGFSLVGDQDSLNNGNSNEVEYEVTNDDYEILATPLMIVSIPTIVTSIMDEGHHDERHRSSIKKHMGDWTRMKMTLKTARTHIQQHYPEYMTLFRSLPYDEQRINMGRYLWLHHYGGLVLDSTLKLNAPLDTLFYYDADLYLLPSRWNGGLYSLKLMASRPQHPFWLDVVEAMRDAVMDPPAWAVTRETLITTTSGSYLLSQVLTTTDYHYVTLSRGVVDPSTPCEGSDRGMIQDLTDRTSWFGCNWKIVVIIVVTTLIILVLVVGILGGWLLASTDCEPCQTPNTKSITPELPVDKCTPTTTA